MGPEKVHSERGQKGIKFRNSEEKHKFKDDFNKNLNTVLKKIDINMLLPQNLKEKS